MYKPGNLTFNVLKEFFKPWNACVYSSTIQSRRRQKALNAVHIFLKSKNFNGISLEFPLSFQVKKKTTMFQLCVVTLMHP